MDYLEDFFELVKKHIFAIVATIFGIISIVGSVIYVNIMLEPCEECEVCEYIHVDGIEDDYTEEKDDEPKKLVVDVKGAVKKPGVYELANGSKIQDAITMAGGITIYGSTANINLSKRVTDEMVVYVFTKAELEKKASANEVVCEIPKCECETVTITECPDVNGNGTGGDKDKDNSGSNNKNDDEADDKSNADEKVSLNKATVDELTKLDGIGEAKAKTIVEYREKNGPFEKIEDIQKVSGIGEVLYEKIKDKLTL